MTDNQHEQDLEQDNEHKAGLQALYKAMSGKDEPPAPPPIEHALRGFGAWIEALMILQKYAPNKTFIMSAEHDVIYIHGDPLKVSADDKTRLEVLGFSPDEDLDCFYFYT